MTIYAIPDIHGRAEALDAAHERIAADRAREGAGGAPVVHLGDLTDRGPDSRGVIERLVAGLARGEPWIVLRGNHDRMFLNFVRDGLATDGVLREDATWLHPALGGCETLASYGVRAEGPVERVSEAARAAVPEAHVAFMAERPLWHVTEDLLFVHAGIRPGFPLDRQAEDDLVWIRDEFLFDERDHGRLVVHGHTVVDVPTHFGNRVALDAGAGYGRPLVAAVFEGREAWVLEEDGRVPLRPL